MTIEQNMLEAMDGIAMILDHGLRIEKVGWTNWRLFMDQNPPHDPNARVLAKHDVLDHPITEFIAGDTVRDTFSELFQSVLDGKRPVLQFDYRCDSPTVRRDMRLSVRPFVAADGRNRLLYQSMQIHIAHRPAIGLYGAPVAYVDEKDILTLCSICARVAWPVGAPHGHREWLEPAEYYRRGGTEVNRLSHGFCAACFAALHEED